jgi:RNA polymerase sigma-70 factor (ECF subfamily)
MNAAPSASLAEPVGAPIASDFDELFRRLIPSARRVCERLLGDPVAAEDAAAEAFVRALVRWPKLRAHPNPDAWVLRVASNIALDQLRKQRRERPPGRPSQTGATEASVDDVPVLGIDSMRALASLPKRQREVLVLRHVIGMTESEAAAAMGVSINTVKTHGARGIAALKSNTDLDLGGWE